MLLDGDGNCARRKAGVEEKAAGAGLLTKAAASPGPLFHMLNRVAVQAPQAWWLGDRAASMAACPGIWPAHFRGVARGPGQLPKPNATLWQVLKHGCYFAASKRKAQGASAVGPHLDPARNTSASFRCCCEGLAARQ
ncbi:hypothetical protein [Hymenobacter cheonanensis]|uniref:hypothetical protein n=1 Tax=Hymenobacter sp. CA2-7 TaxID=3063993 RepID=UPI002713823E|nr:hypothetical protein [Hymenobacter sp. CA2-7]MDO7886057.1 hypothetical protein [Hymenobacter sp. CA2-7]